MKFRLLDPTRALLLFLFFSFSMMAQSLQITSPGNGAVVSPGQTLNVTVDASGSFTDVVVGGDGNLGSSQNLKAPRYSFSIRIPATVNSRVYALNALGFTGSGKMVVSAPISIDVERSEKPTKLIVHPSVLHLRVGEKAYLIVTGIFPDGTRTDLTESTAVTYQSDAPNVVTVTADGRVVAIGSGNARIQVSDFIVPVEVERQVWLVPYEVRLHASETSKFIAHVNIPSNRSVVWSISPPGAGTVDENGLYTAPSTIDAQEFITVTATSMADNAPSGSATILLLPPISVIVSPTTAMLRQSQTQAFTAAVANDLHRAVRWKITPAGVGSITGTGVYTAPRSITSAQTVTLTATSVDSASAVATATVKLTPQGN